MRFFGKLVVTVTLIFVYLSALCISGEIDSINVEIEVIPDTIKLTPHVEAKALAIVRNKSATSLKNIRLSWLSDSTLKLSIEPPASKNLVPGGELVWVLSCKDEGRGFTSRDVYVKCDFVWNRNTTSESVPGVVYSTLSVESSAPEASAQIADVQVNTVLESLMEHKPGIIYLTIKDTADFPIEITKIMSRGPEFIKFNEVNLFSVKTIKPGETYVFPIKIEATESVRPGKHLLLFDVNLNLIKDDHRWTRNIIATQEIEVGIFGEAEILVAIGVPSFLILPGFLMLLTLGLLWKHIAPQTEFKLKLDTPNFWFVAITLSLLTAIAYPLVTGWIGVSRNYLEGYGLGDVVRVWFGSIIFSALAYLVVAVAINQGNHLLSWFLSWKRNRIIPTENDDAINILTKLQRQKLKIKLKRIKVNIKGNVQNAYLLEDKKEGQQEIWIGPRIKISWKDSAKKEFKEKVNAHLGEKSSLKPLIKLLKKGKKQDCLNVDWTPIEKIKGPKRVKMEDIVDYLDPGIIIEIED